MSHRQHRFARSRFLAGLLAAWPLAASAQVILDTQHADIGLGFKDAWDLHVHDETNDVEYEPGDVLFYAGDNTTLPRPAGGQWDFLGVPAGQNIWVLPFAPAPDTLYLGVAAEEVKPGTFLSYFEADPRVAQEGVWVRLSLLDMRGPGEFSIWTTDAFGQPIVWMSTFDNPLDNALFVLESQHAHFNWGFTAEGIYEIDVAASALLPDGTLVTSDVATYTFGVKEVPEPASLLALCCMLPVLARRR